MTSAGDDDKDPLDKPERSDHDQRVAAIVRTFFLDSRFFTVAPGAVAASVVAARLARSTKSFSRGQVVYLYDVFWGINERARVVGRHRRKHHFIRGVCPIGSLVAARPKIACAPAVLGKLDGTMVDGGIFLRFCNLRGGFTHFDGYRRHVLDTPNLLRARDPSPPVGLSSAPMGLPPSHAQAGSGTEAELREGPLLRRIEELKHDLESCPFHQVAAWASIEQELEQVRAQLTLLRNTLGDTKP